MMQIIVDGYNVTMADDATRRLPRQDQRLALVRRLTTRGRDLLGPGEIVVVFDGGRLAADEGTARVEVEFSGDESADDVIVRLAEERGGEVTVVTSDRELRSRVRERAGRSVAVLPCSALFEDARPSRHRRRGPVRDPHGGLPRGHEGITRELEDIWLPEDGSAR